MATRKALAALGLVLCLVRPGHAQVMVWSMAWEQPEPIAAVLGFRYTLKIDTATPVSVTPTCIAQGAGSTCTAPLPGLSSGPHTLTLNAINGFGTSAGATLAGTPPGMPSGFRLSITIGQ